jgi:hypothetical protein
MSGAASTRAPTRCSPSGASRDTSSARASGVAQTRSDLVTKKRYLYRLSQNHKQPRCPRAQMIIVDRTSATPMFYKIQRSLEDIKMKYAIIALLLAFSVNEANAVVYCAAGVVRAGCVARRPVGAAVVVAPRAAVVAPRCRIVNGARVCVR